MIVNHGVEIQTGSPSAPRHTACTTAREDSSCSKHFRKFKQEKDALLDETLDTSQKAVDFVPRYKVGRFSFFSISSWANTAYISMSILLMASIISFAMALSK